MDCPPGRPHELLDAHSFVVARFDLAYPEATLAIEYDGKGHALREFTKDDRFRDATTGDHGWHTMRPGYEDVVITGRRTVQLVGKHADAAPGPGATEFDTRVVPTMIGPLSCRVRRCRSRVAGTDHLG